MSEESISVKPPGLESGSNARDFQNRLYFLYQTVQDTQATVRFLDTKAAFCVTLLSGMAALSVQHREAHPPLHSVLFALFLLVEVFAIMVCLRVIFPTVKPHSNTNGPLKPAFYIGHNKAHHWILHTVANPEDNILSESKASYLRSMEEATDEDLVSSLCDAVLTLAYIRQIKSDRIHAAMFCLIASVFMFVAVLMVD